MQTEKEQQGPENQSPPVEEQALLHQAALEADEANFFRHTHQKLQETSSSLPEGHPLANEVRKLITATDPGINDFDLIITTNSSPEAYTIKATHTSHKNIVSVSTGFLSGIQAYCTELQFEYNEYLGPLLCTILFHEFGHWLPEAKTMHLNETFCDMYGFKKSAARHNTKAAREAIVFLEWLETWNKTQLGLSTDSTDHGSLSHPQSSQRGVVITAQEMDPEQYYTGRYAEPWIFPTQVVEAAQKASAERYSRLADLATLIDQEKFEELISSAQSISEIATIVQNYTESSTSLAAAQLILEPELFQNLLQDLIATNSNHFRLNTPDFRVQNRLARNLTEQEYTQLTDQNFTSVKTVLQSTETSRPSFLLDWLTDQAVKFFENSQPSYAVEHLPLKNASEVRTENFEGHKSETYLSKKICDQLCFALASYFIRTASNDSHLSFGRWPEIFFPDTHLPELKDWLSQHTLNPNQLRSLVLQKVITFLPEYTHQNVAEDFSTVLLAASNTQPFHEQPNFKVENDWEQIQQAVEIVVGHPLYLLIQNPSQSLSFGIPGLKALEQSMSQYVLHLFDTCPAENRPALIALFSQNYPTITYEDRNLVNGERNTGHNLEWWRLIQPDAKQYLNSLFLNKVEKKDGLSQSGNFAPATLDDLATLYLHVANANIRKRILNELTEHEEFLNSPSWLDAFLHQASEKKWLHGDVLSKILDVCLTRIEKQRHYYQQNDNVIELIKILTNYAHLLDQEGQDAFNSIKCTLFIEKKGLLFTNFSNAMSELVAYVKSGETIGINFPNSLPGKESVWSIFSIRDRTGKNWLIRDTTLAEIEPVVQELLNYIDNIPATSLNEINNLTNFAVWMRLQCFIAQEKLGDITRLDTIESKEDFLKLSDFVRQQPDCSIKNYLLLVFAKGFKRKTTAVFSYDRPLSFSLEYVDMENILKNLGKMVWNLADSYSYESPLRPIITYPYALSKKPASGQAEDMLFFIDTSTNFIEVFGLFALEFTTQQEQQYGSDYQTRIANVCELIPVACGLRDLLLEMQISDSSKLSEEEKTRLNVLLYPLFFRDAIKDLYGSKIAAEQLLTCSNFGSGLLLIQKLLPNKSLVRNQHLLKLLQDFDVTPTQLNQFGTLLFENDFATNDRDKKIHSGIIELIGTNIGNLPAADRTQLLLLFLKKNRHITSKEELDEAFFDSFIKNQIKEDVSWRISYSTQNETLDWNEITNCLASCLLLKFQGKDITSTLETLFDHNLGPNPENVVAKLQEWVDGMTITELIQMTTPSNLERKLSTIFSESNERNLSLTSLAKKFFLAPAHFRRDLIFRICLGGDGPFDRDNFAQHGSELVNAVFEVGFEMAAQNEATHEDPYFAWANEHSSEIQQTIVTFFSTLSPEVRTEVLTRFINGLATQYPDLSITVLAKALLSSLSILGSKIAQLDSLFPQHFQEALQEFKENVPPIPKHVVHKILSINGVADSVEQYLASFGGSTASVQLVRTNDQYKPDRIWKILRLENNELIEEILVGVGEAVSTAAQLGLLNSNPSSIVTQLSNFIRVELDARNEAKTMLAHREIREKLKRNQISIPEVFFSSDHLLQTEQARSKSLATIMTEESAITTDEKTSLSRSVVADFFWQVFILGNYHADLQQGNIFVDEANTISEIDFGQTGEIANPQQRRELFELFSSIVLRDHHSFKKALYKLTNQDTTAVSKVIDTIDLADPKRAFQKILELHDELQLNETVVTLSKALLSIAPTLLQATQGLTGKSWLSYELLKIKTRQFGKLPSLSQ